jgi:hypothetical protein
MGNGINHPTALYSRKPNAGVVLLPEAGEVTSFSSRSPVIEETGLSCLPPSSLLRENAALEEVRDNSIELLLHLTFSLRGMKLIDADNEKLICFSSFFAL